MQKLLLAVLIGVMAIISAVAIFTALREEPGPATPPVVPTAPPTTPTSTPLRPVVETPVSFPKETPPIPTPLPPSPGAPGATVEIASMTLFPGERGRVPIWVRGVTGSLGLGAFDFQVTFSPAQLKVIGVWGGESPFDSTPVYGANNDKGVLLFNNFHAAIPGPQGDILVAHIEVEAQVALNTASALHLTIRNLVNTNGDEIVAGTQSP